VGWRVGYPSLGMLESSS